MSTRPEKYIHQKESAEDRHKRDYSTELFEEWIASQGNEDMMDLDDNDIILTESKVRSRYTQLHLLSSSHPTSAHPIRIHILKFGCRWVFTDADGCIIQSDDATIRKIQSGDGCFFQ
ncbi:hypothetical protein BDC45DRAFT_563926 [Circinella umbellata]|nr:hypothetical protein BDC45DRAFT_575881 [Circinella umbellata]KAI7849529.1 hypothetical protein BDC45DRAFT_573906 [Circinella umbellata]KAI7859894.1 hypothetical protein BDC45DRAFT_563926 [Circinella umbellata]